MFYTHYLLHERIGLPLATVLLALSVALRGGVALAQEQDERLEVDSVEFIGVESLDEDRLASVLATRPSAWLPWRPARYFDPDAFELDLRRIVAYYRDHGFPEAQILSRRRGRFRRGTRFDHRPHRRRRASDGRRRRARGSARRRGPGRRTHLRRAAAPASGAAARRPAGRAWRRCRSRPALAGAEHAVTALKNDGFAYAEVRIERDEIDPKQIRLRYVAEPGDRAFFGPIEIVGNASVDDSIVRRQVVYEPGALFRLDQVRESQRRLYGLELFDFASIEPLEAGNPIDVPTRVTLAEGDHRKLEFSAGWGTEEKLRGEASWRHVNFYGGARVLVARGKWSSLEQGGELDFRQPYLFRPDLSLALNGHTWYADELAYRASSEGGRAAVEGQTGRSTTWSATYTHEFASSQISNEALRDLTLRDTLIALGLDPTTGEQNGVLSSLSFTMRRATSENLLNPRSGYVASLALEQAGTLLPGDFNYTSVNLDVRGYVPLGDQLVLAGRAHAATIDPAGDADDNVPFFKRYFLGGSTSLRGWGRFEVAPLSASGLPLGGFSLFELSAEVRTRVWGNIGLVAFLDAGKVWHDQWVLTPGDLLYDIGPGLTYLTPVGPCASTSPTSSRRSRTCSSRASLSSADGGFTSVSARRSEKWES